MIRAIIALSLLTASAWLIPAASFAQVQPVCVVADGRCASAANPLPVNASVSASITGFRPTAYGTPFTATTGGVTGTLPAGAEVVVSNTGAVTAYCQLGASATTSSQPVPAGGWFGFAISGDTQLSCITASSTAVINMAGGSGLPTGAGGGGGGGGGSVTQGTSPWVTAEQTTFSAHPSASVTRSANTTTYTVKTGWNNGTPTTFSFTGACRTNGGAIIINGVDVWSSANPTVLLQGNLWLFSGVPSTVISDNAAFTLGAASGNPSTGDFALLTGGSINGLPFTLASNQTSGVNSGATLAGTNYAANCAGGTTTITGQVEVMNAYVPVSAEVLTVQLHIVGTN